MAAELSIDPHDILDFWFRDAADAPALAQARGEVWFGTSDEMDTDCQRFAAAIEQAFLILPYQHCESIEEQRESMRFSEQILVRAAPDWRPLLEVYADYARRHEMLIERFGRFPHRNDVLGRESTPAERAFLSAGAENFGQGVR